MTSYVITHLCMCRYHWPLMSCLFYFLPLYSCRDRMLPPESFKPRSPARSTQYGNYHDSYYDDFYGGGGSYSGSSHEVIIILMCRYNNLYFTHSIVFIQQWDPVRTVTNGPKYLVVLIGRVESHDGSTLSKSLTEI